MTDIPMNHILIFFGVAFAVIGAIIAYWLYLIASGLGVLLATLVGCSDQVRKGLAGIEDAVQRPARQGTPDFEAFWPFGSVASILSNVIFCWPSTCAGRRE